MDVHRRLEALRKLQRLLDEAFRVPGTNLRFGWDPIIGLVPWIGDALTALAGCAILVQAHQMRLPLVVRLRMVLNLAIDVVLSAVPVLGNLADVFWKSNVRNFTLLEKHAAERSESAVGDWVFVGGVLIVVLGAVLVPFIVLYWLVHALVGSASL